MSEMYVEAVEWIRTAAHEVTGGNCAFVDDDLRVLAHLAMRAIDAGLTDGLNEGVRANLPPPDNRPAPDKLALAVEALEFYAQPVWSINGNFNEPSPHSEYRPDCGDTARQALAAIKAST